MQGRRAELASPGLEMSAVSPEFHVETAGDDLDGPSGSVHRTP